MDGGLKNLTLKAVEVDSREDLAFEVGAFTLDAPGEGGAMTTVAGKYIVVWKKGEDGTWRLHRDIWNAGAAE
jgi:ketosteroid isomerase-like protein